MGDKKSTTFITTEGLIAEFKLLSFFQLRNEDVKIVIFNEKKEAAKQVIYPEVKFIK